MRVDLTTANLEAAERNKTARAGQGGAGGERGRRRDGGKWGSGPHKFSFDQTRISSLTSQALAAPEVREAKVAALGQSIADGEYVVDATKVAVAMTEEYGGGVVR